MGKQIYNEAIRTIRKQSEKEGSNKFNKSGIYILICADCPMRHIGQSGRTFNKDKQVERKTKLKVCPKTVDTGHTNGTTEDKLKMPHVAKMNNL
jgi:hypothetical protein